VIVENLPKHGLQWTGGQRRFAARWLSQRLVVALPPPLNPMPLCLKDTSSQEGSSMVKARGLRPESCHQKFSCVFRGG
jgi:hypothetical protein